MSKISDLGMTLDALRECAETLTDAVNWLEVAFSGTPQEPEKPMLTLEEVRAVLADKSRAGLTAEIRTLLQKYGAGKLSEVDPASYEALLKDAEELAND